MQAPHDQLDPLSSIDSEDDEPNGDAKRRRIEGSIEDQRQFFTLDCSRTILHLDIDSFYAQVHEVEDPRLRRIPFGVQQKYLVVTCNYVARSLGVKKLMYIQQAKDICPDLILVR